MARFNSLNEGPYAVDPIDPDTTEDYSPPDELQARLNELRNPGKKSDSPPDELQARLNELRNPGKMERELEDYEARQRRYMERHGDDFDFGQRYEPGMPLKKEELPLDTDVYSEAVKKIQKVERGRQSRKKYTKKKPEQKKSMKKKGGKKKGGKKKRGKKKKKRYYGGTLTLEQLRKARLKHLREPISNTGESSNTRRLKEHFLTGIEEETHSSNFEPEPEPEPEPANEVVANEEFPLGTGAEHWLPEETEKELYNSIVGTSDYPTIEDCRRLKEYCVLFPKTCYLNKKFLEEKVHVCREVVKTNNDINSFFISPYAALTEEAQRELGLGQWHEYENWKDIIANIVKDGIIENYLTSYGPTPPSGNHGLIQYRQSDILNSLKNIVYKIYGVNPNNRAEVDEFDTMGELYGQGYAETWMDIVDTLKGPRHIKSIEFRKNNFNRYLYEFSIELKNKGYPIMLIERVKQEFIDLLSIYDGWSY